VLRDDSVHNRWVNSRALELAGIASGTPDPADGVIVRDEATGAPVGLLFESAVAAVEQANRAANPPSREIYVAALARAIAILNSFESPACRTPRSAARPCPPIIISTRTGNFRLGSSAL